MTMLVRNLDLKIIKNKVRRSRRRFNKVKKLQYMLIFCLGTLQNFSIKQKILVQFFPFFGQIFYFF